MQKRKKEKKSQSETSLPGLESHLAKITENRPSCFSNWTSQSPSTAWRKKFSSESQKGALACFTQKGGVVTQKGEIQSHLKGEGNILKQYILKGSQTRKWIHFNNQFLGRYSMTLGKSGTGNLWRQTGKGRQEASSMQNHGKLGWDNPPTSISPPIKHTQTQTPITHICTRMQAQWPWGLHSHALPTASQNNLPEEWVQLYGMWFPACRVLCHRSLPRASVEKWKEEMRDLSSYSSE